LVCVDELLHNNVVDRNVMMQQTIIVLLSIEQRAAAVHTVSVKLECDSIAGNFLAPSSIET